MQVIKQKDAKIWVADNASSYFQIEWFDPSNNSVLKHAEQWQSGRQSVTKLKFEDYYMVLRHYCRGGLPARFSRDRFLFRGWNATRAYKELYLLEKMIDLGLPVPHPVASKSELTSIFYTSDIIMHEIRNSKTLAQVLIKERLVPQIWRKIGYMIKKFHVAGIQHIDLNANNILIDGQERLYLIDFDRCIQHDYSQEWGGRGLMRLKRSLLKIQRINKHLFFTEDDFQVLCAGYDE